MIYLCKNQAMKFEAFAKRLNQMLIESNAPANLSAPHTQNTPQNLESHPRKSEPATIQAFYAQQPHPMTNKIYYGDNLDVLRRYIKDESVDLCYIDPPFNSKRNYNQIYNNVGKEDSAQAQAFIDTWTWDDIATQGLTEIKSNYNGVFTEQSIDLITGLEKVLKKGALLAYLVSMTLRIAEIHRVLKPTGSFYFHCDPTASHYLKLVLDGIFCVREGDFVNEIIWHYRTFQGQARRYFPKKHDTIFLYSKSQNFVFNESYDTDFDETIDSKRWSKYFNEKNEITASNMPDHDTRFIRYLNKWKRLNSRNPDPTDVIYEAKGQLVDTVWDMKGLDPKSKERMGYPTQKPEALLERIIKASSNEGDIILDAYCGCGTTVAVANRLKRQWIGIDITYQSISLILKRLTEHDKSLLDTIEINGVPKDINSVIALANKSDDRTRKEFEKWIVLTYSNNRAMINEKKGGDGGIDGMAYITHNHDKEIKKVLFSVKSNIKLTPAVIRELNGTVERDNAACGILLTLYPMPNLVKDSKQYGNYFNEFNRKDYPKIQVICVEDIFNGVRLELPNIPEVLKKAEQHAEQASLF